MTACGKRKEVAGLDDDQAQRATEEPNKRPQLLRFNSSVRDLVDAGVSTDTIGLESGPQEASSLGTPWRRLILVGGFTTEVYGVHHVCLGGPKLKVLVIPGNPGQAAYYLPLLRHLHAQLDGLADIMAISHKGHGINCRGNQVFSLQDQIEHKVQFIKQYCLDSDQGSLGLAIVGHSIGAYMALHATKIVETWHKSRLPEAGSSDKVAENTSGPIRNDECRNQICKVVGVFPFLSVDSRGSTRQTLLRNVCQMPRLLAATGSILGLLPEGLRHSIIRVCGGNELQEHAVDSTGMLLRYWNCYNAFHLAKTEFEDLASPPDWELISRLGHRAAMVVCPNDMWAPDWMMQEMQQAIPSLQVVHDSSMVHSFCVSDSMSKTMATLLRDMLPRVVLDSNSELGGNCGRDHA